MCDEYSKVSELPVEVKEKKPPAEPVGDQPQDDIKEVPKDKSLGSDDEHNVSGEEANNEGEEEKKEEVLELEKRPNQISPNWTSKVARYLAYAVDGGILCS